MKKLLLAQLMGIEPAALDAEDDTEALYHPGEGGKDEVLLEAWKEREQEQIIERFLRLEETVKGLYPFFYRLDEELKPIRKRLAKSGKQVSKAEVLKAYAEAKPEKFERLREMVDHEGNWLQDREGPIQ